MSTTTLTTNVRGYRLTGVDRAAEYVSHVNEAAGTAIMLVTAPFIGLAFVIVLPFAGLAYVTWLAMKGLLAGRVAFWRRVRNVILFFAAPFFGLAYAVALPFVGIGALVWLGVNAARKSPAAG
jgi:hypothetical protein